MATRKRPVKLIIQIPCYNEGRTLAQVLDDLPQAIPGVDRIETLVVNDGSRDETVQVARERGADHIVDLPRHKGLAFAWSAGIDASLREGADIIVNTDGDNQYDGGCIAELIAPIVEGRLDVVVGCRPIEQIEEFSWWKKRLQRLGSRMVRQFSGTDIPGQ